LNDETTIKLIRAVICTVDPQLSTSLFLELGKSVQISEFVQITKPIDLHTALCLNTLIEQSHLAFRIEVYG